MLVEACSFWMAGCFRWVKNRNEPTRDVKLVVIGLDDAGKTTTIACLQGEPPDGITPTIGFSNASISVGKWNITLYDLGGGSGVRSVWPKYYAEIYGMIFTVDSGDHNRIAESKNVLNEVFDDPKVNGKPVVVFANKQDKDGALNEEEICEKLSLQQLSKEYNFKFNVFSCSAIKGYGKTMDKRIRSGLEWLLDAINQDYLIINEKVTKESTIQREQELKEKKERMERIRKLREERENAAQEAGIEEKEESDDDVVTNPFRSINDQIEVTQKREKKAKEKMKKIKEHQMKNNGESQTEGETTETNETTKNNKRKKKVKADNDSEHEDNGGDGEDEDNDSEKRQKRRSSKKVKKISFQGEQMSASEDEGLSPKQKNKKNKSPKSKRTSDDDGDSDEDCELSPKKKKKGKPVKNKTQADDDTIDDSDGPKTLPHRKIKKTKEKVNTEEQFHDEDHCKSKGKKNITKKNENRTCNNVENKLSDEYQKMNIDKIPVLNELAYVNGSVDPTKNNIIYVSSKESVRESSPVMKKKKSIKSMELLSYNDEDAELDEHSDDYGTTSKSAKKKLSDRDINDYKTLTQKEVNDSRAELFLAKSTESLDREADITCCNNNNAKKGKKKKKKEFDDVQGTQGDKKKKKKKKANKTEPQLACPPQPSEDMFTNGGLPPLRGASKLEPIKLKGRLPKWNNSDESSIPSWALARPNFDDDNLLT